LFLISDYFLQPSYLFNCGEGTQRFCIEHKVRLARVDHIFVTQLSWDYIGGIPGGLLSLYEMGLKNINLFGPKGLKNFLEACRYFFQRPDMTFRIREFEDTDFFQDENRHECGAQGAVVSFRLSVARRTKRRPSQTPNLMMSTSRTLRRL
jgi:ribonuclease BN (tRNA processing enzyme)